MQRVHHARGWSFLPKVTFIITLGLITAATGFKASAIDVFTDPVGFITLTSVGNGFSYVSLGMTQIPALRGVVNAVAGQKLTLNSTLTPNQYIGPGGATQFFIEITSGPNAGLTDDIISNDTAAVYTASDDSAQVAATETFKIYPHWTLDTAFGPPATSGLNGASTLGGADNLLVWNPLAQGSATYWYRTTGATPGWRDSFSTTINRGTNVLYIDQGIVVQRKVTGTASTLLVGGVKLGPTIIPAVASGYTYAGMVYASSYTLNSSQLFTTNSATGVAGASTLGGADNVFIWDPIAQGSATYWWRSTGATPGWRDSFSTTIDRGTNALPFGAVMVVQRKGATPFNYTAPAPY
jgi:uncharacterized protein (TIGR02597 family)